jgi:hypothetical protein
LNQLGLRLKIGLSVILSIKKSKDDSKNHHRKTKLFQGELIVLSVSAPSKKLSLVKSLVHQI